ncbi:stage V sporulation protein AB [Gracilibacillus dipsosauri]|uniref:Stage V sporulation protein AB n=2 Tax=Gracilibacillus TaxID=74385 RepID=A0A317KYM7_9BACI|nr:stage V sporulation protein AB [Gracilibacillus dipsosauri]PWU68597.1 stage V sporulation protein AB [Gracilibacillus dipsosauri]
MRSIIAETIIGFGSGIIVGSGLVALLTVLGIIPRLVQLSKSYTFVKSYQAAVILGGIIGTLFSFSQISIHVPILIQVLFGLFHGVFIGMLAAALTEVLNVFPILMKRLGMSTALLWLLMAIVLGKIFGSLFHWITFVDIMSS